MVTLDERVTATIEQNTSQCCWTMGDWKRVPRNIRSIMAKARCALYPLKHRNIGLHVADLLVIGTGPSTQVLSPGTRKLFNNMGIRVEISDTRNAAAQYNLLATERGVHEVGAIMIPAGWTPK